MVCKATEAAYRRLREAARVAWAADVVWVAEAAGTAYRRLREAARAVLCEREGVGGA